MSTWFVVLTKNRQEEWVQENLERQGYRTYLPVRKTAKLQRGKRVEVAQKLFPRHVLVELDLETQDFSPIRSTFGAIGLVQYGSEPAEVPAGLIEVLIERDHQELSPTLDGAESLAEPAISLDAGLVQKVQAMLNGADGEHRVMLLMEMLSKSRLQAKPSGSRARASI